MKVDVKKIRVAAKLNQVEFGLICGVHYQTVSRWERGDIEPTEYQKFIIGKISKKLISFKNARAFLITHGPTQFLDVLM